MTARLHRPSAGDAVTLTLTDEIDIARGDVLVSPTAGPEVSDQFAAHVIWMSEEPLFPGRSYLVRIGTKTVPASITDAQIQDRRQYARASGRAHARPQRDRLLQSLHVRSGRLRSL